MRDKLIIAANWKMQLLLEEAKTLSAEVKRRWTEGQFEKSEIILGVPAPYLQAVQNTVGESGIAVSAQDCSARDFGAFTGEFHAAQIASVGAECVILGHSERREYHNESDDVIAAKLRRALEAQLRPILCVGERLEERKANKQEQIVAEQLRDCLTTFSKEDLKHLVVAYEPVWAIGTGETASPAQAQEMHAFIRTLIREMYDADFANNLPILYGGSVKPDNAADIFAQADVNGGLIGGASLKAESFMALVEIAESL